MQAVLFREFGAASEIVDVPMPVCSPGGAVIRVGASGLCRSEHFGGIAGGADPCRFGLCWAKVVQGAVFSQQCVFDSLLGKVKVGADDRQ